MSSFREQFQFHLPTPSRLHIEMRGVLADNATDELIRLTVDALANQPQVREVLVDIRKLDECTDAARVGLGSLQKLLGRRRLRTAWLAGSARTHGLARLVVVRTSDPNAATFISLEQAEGWFGETTERLEGIRAKVGKV